LRDKSPPNLNKRILHGEREPIFRALPQSVLDNLRSPSSETAVLWNLIYPLARPSLSLDKLLAIQPIWGSKNDLQEDELAPYFWGHALSGVRLPILDDTLGAVEGKGPRTEVDLFLVGDRNLIAIEGKHLAALGRCSRYQKSSCPEIHGSPVEDDCRYWERRISRFSSLMDFGTRPDVETQNPPCHRHYQLARTLLVGVRMAEALDLAMHLWLLIPRMRWSSAERDWMDFADRVKDEGLWKRMRVIALEDLGPD
jgi:hypothetical protein